MMSPLSDLDRSLLAFERRRWLHQGVKDEAITVELGLTPTRYTQRLLALIDNPAALQADPMLINRLRRLRETRRQSRTG